MARRGRRCRSPSTPPDAPNRMKVASTHDYGADGISIQTAMVRRVKSNPDRTTRTKYILWDGLHVFTSFDIPVAKKGRFRLEFLSEPESVRQGVDVKAEKGGILLSNGDRVGTLRTWHDLELEPTVEYDFKSRDGLLRLWNVFVRSRPNGSETEEKWTGNAGFIVGQDAENQWTFRCSHGASERPMFDQLVFRFTLLT